MWTRLLPLDIDLPQPHPDMTPREVVELQLSLLRTNNQPYPNYGICAAFNFASPANKETTGPLDRFVQLVQNPLYNFLLNYHTRQMGALTMQGEQATQRVRLVDALGRSALFVFILSRQVHSPFAGCWMTDGVIRC